MREIFNTIVNDLSEYGQHNPAPDSVTFGEGDNFRHYELGEIFGLVAFGNGHITICEVKEDDDNWFCFSGTDKDSYDAHWVKTKMELYQRMYKWLEENCERGYYHGFEGNEKMKCGYTVLKTK